MDNVFEGYGYQKLTQTASKYLVTQDTRNIMGTLLVKRLIPTAHLPATSASREDLGYDLFAVEDVELYPGRATLVKTGIAAVWKPSWLERFWHKLLFLGPPVYGFIIKDRSGMALKSEIQSSAGVVDGGYRGEIGVVLTWVTAPEISSLEPRKLRRGDRIAQMLPRKVLSGAVIEVADLPHGERGARGFGSSGS